MSAALLDGKVLAARIKEQLKTEVSELQKKTNRVLTMVNVMVGSDPAASAYANSQKKVAEYIGISYKLISLDQNIQQKEVIENIERLNKDPQVNGIMVYKPLPKPLDYAVVANHVSPAKDLEGTNAVNFGKLMLGGTKIIPCTPASAMEHIKSIGDKLRGKEAVIVGRSEIVGKPLALLLLAESATVTICHTGTHDAGKLAEHVKRADIVVAAVGKAGFVKGEWIKQGATVIDVGINKVDDKIVGDVEFEAAAKRAAHITPVPGGVGPVTVVMLMKNCIEAFREQNKAN